MFNKNGDILKSIDASSADSFEISFKHSVNKGIVREEYHINELNNSFYLKNAWFESYGAGMLDEIPKNVKMTEDGDFLKLEFQKENLSSVSYAAAGFAGHKLKIKNNVIDLFELSPYKTIIIKIEHITFFHYIFY